MNIRSILEPVIREHREVEKEINRQIAGILSRHTGESWSDEYIGRVMHHVFNTPGKMLRPGMFLLSAKSSAGDSGAYEERREALVQLAAGIELLHTASLIHDDIIDEADSRRSRTSLNAEYGVKIAVLVGDIIFAQFFSIVLNLPVEDWDLKSRLLSLFSNLTQSMCFGEVFQQKLLSMRTGTEFGDYLTILEKKTALLMEASCRSGALLAGASDRKVEALASFGLNFGYAFQLADDLADDDAVYADSSRIAQEGLSRLNTARESLSGNIDASFIDNFCGLCEFLKFA